MEVYRFETSEILKRYREERISRAECVEALDSALLAAIPDLLPSELPAVQSILAENARCLAEIDGKKHPHDVNASSDQAESFA